MDCALVVFLSVFLYSMSDGLAFWRRTTIASIGPFYMFFMRFGLACQSLGYHFGREKAEVMSRRFWGYLALVSLPAPIIGSIMIFVTDS
jgi:hypothetical protein